MLSGQGQIIHENIREEAQEIKRRLSTKGQEVDETVICELLDSLDPGHETDRAEYIINMIMGNQDSDSQRSLNETGLTTVENEFQDDGEHDREHDSEHDSEEHDIILESEVSQDQHDSEIIFESEVQNPSAKKVEIIDLFTDSDDDRDYYYEFNNYNDSLANDDIAMPNEPTATSSSCTAFNTILDRAFVEENNNNNDVVFMKSVTYEKNKSSESPKPGCSKDSDDKSQKLEEFCSDCNFDELQLEAKKIHSLLPKCNYPLIYKTLQNNQLAKNRIELTLWDLLPVERPNPKLGYKRKCTPYETHSIKYKRNSHNSVRSEKNTADITVSDKEKQICAKDEIKTLNVDELKREFTPLMNDADTATTSSEKEQISARNEEHILNVELKNREFMSLMNEGMMMDVTEEDSYITVMNNTNVTEDSYITEMNNTNVTEDSYISVMNNTNDDTNNQQIGMVPEAKLNQLDMHTSNVNTCKDVHDSKNLESSENYSKNKEELKNLAVPVMAETDLDFTLPTTVPTTSIVVSSVTMSSIASLSTAMPSTAMPSTAMPSTAMPSTAVPSTAVPSTAVPSTAMPSTAVLSIAVPSIAVSSIAMPSIAVPSIATPSIATPSIATPSIAMPSIAMPSITVPGITVSGIAVPSAAMSRIPVLNTIVSSTATSSIPVLNIASNTAMLSTAVPRPVIPSTAGSSIAMTSTIIPKTIVSDTIPRIAVRDFALASTSMSTTTMPHTIVSGAAVENIAMASTVMPRPIMSNTTTSSIAVPKNVIAKNSTSVLRPARFTGASTVVKQSAPILTPPKLTHVTGAIRKTIKRDLDTNRTATNVRPKAAIPIATITKGSNNVMVNNMMVNNVMAKIARNNVRPLNYVTAVTGEEVYKQLGTFLNQLDCIDASFNAAEDNTIVSRNKTLSKTKESRLPEGPFGSTIRPVPVMEMEMINNSTIMIEPTMPSSAQSSKLAASGSGTSHNSQMESVKTNTFIPYSSLRKTSSGEGTSNLNQQGSSSMNAFLQFNDAKKIRETFAAPHPVETNAHGQNIVNNAGPQEIVLNEEARKMYYKLIPMFPCTDTTYIKKLCQASITDTMVHTDPILLQRLVDHLLDNGQKYPIIRKIEPALALNNSNTYDLNDQYADLLGIFPEADPMYLRNVAEEMYRDPEKIKQFVQSKLENPDYPTRAQYLAKKEITEQQKQYTTDFKIQKFLELFPDPFSHFENAKRQCKFSPHAVDFLKHHFSKIRVNTLLNTYTEQSNNLSLAAKALEVFSANMKTKRNNKMILTEDIPLLQECAFIQHKAELREYLNKLKKQEEKDFQELKARNELLECQCCFDNECMPSKCSTCKDGHIFCNTCIIRSTEVILADGKTHVVCLLNCGSEFSLSVLQRVLPPTKFSILLCKRQEAEVMAAGVEGLVSCPFCHFASIPPPEDKVFRCLNPNCMKESCRLCKELNHIPLKCNEVKSDAARLYLEEKMTEALIRKCYKCGRTFFKEEGCNKMTCVCGAQMCYICDKPVTNYGHFQGQGVQNSNLCPLWSDDRRMNAESVIKVCQETMKQIKQKNPEVDINVNALLPKLPPKTRGPHEDVAQANIMPAHAERIARQNP